MNDFTHKIAEGMARAIFVTAWADNEAKHGRTCPGMEILEVAPPTPNKVFYEAYRLIGHYETANRMHIACIVDKAVRSETGKPHDGDMDILWNIGWYMAMMSLGHGVTWFDDHAEFPLEIPEIENELQYA